MELTREESYKMIQAIRDSYIGKKKGDWNEQQTRLLIINSVLEALGWQKEDFNPETAVSSGESIDYLDYLLKSNGKPRLVVEAKKVGYTFTSPRQNLKKNEYQLSYLQSAFGPSLNEVLKQAKRYCTSTHVPFALITNGAEWMLLQLYPPPGKTINDLQGFYLGNIFSADGELNFDLFWRLISKTSIAQRGLEEAFNEINSIESEYAYEARPALGDLKLSQPIIDEQNLLRDYYDRFFDEISDSRRRAMLDYCFVTSAKLDQYEGELKRTLADTAPSFLPNSNAQQRKRMELNPEDDSTVIRDSSGDQKGRVILVVGAVGAGKTTFITRAIINNRGSGINFVRINLINEGADQMVATEKLWELVYKEWLEEQKDNFTHDKLAAIFDSEIRQMKVGPKERLYARDRDLFETDEAMLLEQYFKDPEFFVTKSFRHFDRAFGKSVVLILDNVDRTSELYQKIVYAFAHKVADTTGCLVIITMRESTYFRGREAGFLDVRTSDKVFHLKSPDPMKVLARRIEYVENHIDEDFRVREWRKSGDWPAFKTQAQTLAKQQKESLLLNDEDGRDIVFLLSALSWHSIRHFFIALEHVHSFAQGDKKWRFRDVLATLLLPAEIAGIHSIATTLIHPVEKHHKCFFLKIRILLLLQYGIRQEQRRAGVRAHRIIDLCRTYGYRTVWIKKGIETLVRERLLECLEIPTEPEFTREYSFNEGHTFSPSPLAVVLIEKIVHTDEYLIATMWDLPFHDGSTRTKFIDAVNSQDLKAEAVNQKLTKISVEYLQKLRADEDLLTAASSYSTEVAACEDRLKAVVQQLSSSHHIVQSSVGLVVHRESETTENKQLELSGIEVSESAVDPFLVKLIPIPQSMKSITVHSTRTPPMIFWALANAKASGIAQLTGTEITRIINTHLLNDQQKLAATNVSKSLRGQVMKKQAWLRIIPDSGKHNLFALKDGWKASWRDLFGTEAPDVA